MAETTQILKPVSALEGIAIVGQYGPGKNKGVAIKICPSRSVISASARKGKSGVLSKRMKQHYGLSLPKPGCSSFSNGLVMHWAGPEQWYVIGAPDIADRLSGIASLVDQSHGRLALVISGKNARDVLAKGTPVDLHPDVFKPGNCALTEMAHIAVHIAHIADNEFEISLYRGFAESFWEWLTEMSLEFGYEVK